MVGKKGQPDHAGNAYNSSAQLLDELAAGDESAPCRHKVIDDNDSFPGVDSIGMEMEPVGSYSRSYS